MVKAYQPKVEVTLIKVVQRDRNRTKAATGAESIVKKPMNETSRLPINDNMNATINPNK